MAAVRLRPAELSLGEKLRDLHWPFVTLFAVIGVIGYAVLYSAGGGSHEPWAWRHGLRLAVGIPVMIAVAMIDQPTYHPARLSLEPQLVEDVHAFPGHIACDSASASELVVPILHDGRLIGVLDLDSPRAARFDAEDRDFCIRLVQRVAPRLAGVETAPPQG